MVWISRHFLVTGTQLKNLVARVYKLIHNILKLLYLSLDI